MILQILKEIKSYDLSGELLRELCFVPKFDSRGNQLIGCYNHFDVKDNWTYFKLSQVDKSIQERIGDELGLDPKENQDLSVYQHNEEKIYMSFLYDSDGCLLFILPDGNFYVNRDCKKNYNWEFYEVF